MWNWFKKAPVEAPTTPVIEDAAIAADSPIANTAEDLLGRKVIAERVAAILAAGGKREGRVFAIRGAWGEGKTSLKNMVIELLDGRAPVLDFNPWQWGDSDNIARALFTQMAGKLGGAHGHDAVRRAAALRRYGAILAGGGRLIDKLGSNAALVALVVSGAIALSAAFGLTLPTLDAARLSLLLLAIVGLFSTAGAFLQWLGHDASGDTLDTVREAVENKLRTLRKPLVVFVDDIDRLEPEQIRALVRQIKANANLPNINFVLLFQPSVVEEALGPVSGGNGRDYLEKIVQANFDMPPLTRETVRHVFGTQLGELVDEFAVPANGFQQVRWGNVFLGGVLPMLRNLRDARRLLSSIAIHLEMHKGTSVFEVNIIDFIALETLRVFEPDFYRELAEKKPLLLQSQRFSGDNGETRNREAMKALMDRASAARRGPVETLAKNLFPQIEWAFGGMYYNGGGDWMAEWMQNKRVCTPRAFDRYFALQAVPGTITESDFADLVTAAGSDAATWSAAVDAILQRDLHGALAHRLDESVRDIPLDNPERWFGLILRNGEVLGRSSSAPFNDDFVASWRAAIRYLRRLSSSADALRTLEAALAETKATNVAVQVVSLDCQSAEKPESNYDRLFSPEDLAAAKALAVRYLEIAARDVPKMLTNDSLVSNLYDWRRFAGTDAPRAWAVGVITNDPASVPKMLERFMSVGSVHGMSDHVAERTETFRKQYFDDLLPLSDVESALTNLDTRGLGAEEQRVLALFTDHLRKWKDSPNASPEADE